ncbi:MAG: heavy-metal-associated domain-containing protein [Chloroflexi bacterium]|nr:heavy-metal-associated domain-containing protein [Chloroflexota bacterium]
MLRILPRRLLTEPSAAIERVEARGRGAVATLRVEGLVCDACAARVRSHLRRLPGVRAARIDLESGRARVAYDPARATPEALAAAIAARRCSGPRAGCWPVSPGDPQATDSHRLAQMARPGPRQSVFICVHLWPSAMGKRGQHP